MIKKKYVGDAKLCQIDTDSLIILIKIVNLFEDIVEDVEKKFGTCNYEIKRPLPIGNIEKVVGMMKDECGGAFMKEFVGFHPKLCLYIKDVVKKEKKAQDSKKYVINFKLKMLRLQK